MLVKVSEKENSFTSDGNYNFWRITWQYIEKLKMSIF